MLRNKLFLVIIILIISAFVGFYFYKKSSSINTSPATNNQQTQNPQNDSPKIISTKPDLSSETILSADQIIEINFNTPLENIGEFKHKIDPKIDYKLEISSDRKTVKIIPQTPYELGTEYTIFISPDSKFDGGGRLDGEKIFHFKTVKFRGI